ncbi:LysR family transcriptional regulator [Clostridium sp. MSJ-4]|uniref:LysR family transcriptional regulator n=1 Tax=Clostridium simiarum TaxID=2841506 RepID=A0ABS6EX21_9CLOT|nr:MULTISPECIES: LysR family transcriptional regulator [Clostridium]MBU5590270.1 LysR family transcriptional regulator [Clostridium simiarum]
MNIECFKYFYDVATQKSISKVAANSHISQSALSQQIQKLEDKLGVKLLDRSNKGVELTEEGTLILKHCETITNSYKKMIEDVSSLKEDRNNINIDAFWPISLYAAPLLLYHLKKRFPDYNINLKINSNENIESNVLNDISDIGICYGEPSERNLIYSKLGSDTLTLVASSNYNISDTVKLEDIKDHPLIILNQGIDIGYHIDKLIAKSAEEPLELNILFTTDSIDTAINSVKKGYGIALVPYFSIKNEIENNNLKEIYLEGLDEEFNIYLTYKSDTIRNLRSFVESFKKYMRKILNT